MISCLTYLLFFCFLGSIPEVVAKYVSRAKFSHEALNYPRGKLSTDAVEIGEEPAEQLHVKFEERFLGEFNI